MEQLSVFQFENSANVRTAIINGQVAFCLTDSLLAIKSSTTVTAAVNTIEEGLGKEFVINQPLQTSGGEQLSWFVYEAGLTFIISRSRTELGKRFNRWLHTEVLPSIRKTGLYNPLPFKLADDSKIVSFEADDYWVTSTTIAELFEKRHDNVLRDLESALEDALKFEEMSESIPDFKLIESTYADKYGRAVKCYKVNRALFNYVVLAYQGDKAKLYRMMFIKAFEELEKQVKVFLTQQMIYSNPKRQQVYVLRNTISGMIKVGITNDINRRIAELQNASGCEISLEFLAPKADNSKDIELTLHKLLANKRGIGEWFDVNAEEVISLLKAQDLIINPTQAKLMEAK